VEAALNGTARELVEPIAPPAGSLFVVKACHSIFYQTPLDYMLRQQDIDRLILVGQVTEQCILYSALDGHVRHFDIVIPRDCVAHIHEGLADAALQMMETNMRAHVVTGEEALEVAREPYRSRRGCLRGLTRSSSNIQASTATRDCSPCPARSSLPLRW